MRAVLVGAHGGPGMFQLADVVEPRPGPGQVLVRVAVSGVNYLDVYQRSGAVAVPYVAGVEGVGVVVELGEAVTGIVAGQRVGWFTGGQGSFADLVVVQADKTVLLPEDVDDVTATALMMQGVTAHYLATDAYAVAPGEWILVHAAAGGVGSLLTQVARLRGAHVIGTASDPVKAAAAGRAGAESVIPYDGFADAVRELTDNIGVAAVYDGVGAATFEGSLASLRTRGSLVSFGAASGPVPPFDVTRLAGAGSIYLTRPTVVHYVATQEELRRRTDDLFGWLRVGELFVAPPQRYALTEVAEAFSALESRRTSGKLVLLH